MFLMGVTSVPEKSTRPQKNDTPLAAGTIFVNEDLKEHIYQCLKVQDYPQSLT